MVFRVSGVWLVTLLGNAGRWLGIVTVGRGSTASRIFSGLRERCGAAMAEQTRNQLSFRRTVETAIGRYAILLLIRGGN